MSQSEPPGFNVNEPTDAAHPELRHLAERIARWLVEQRSADDETLYRQAAEALLTARTDAEPVKRLASRLEGWFSGESALSAGPVVLGDAAVAHAEASSGHVVRGDLRATIPAPTVHLTGHVSPPSDAKGQNSYEGPALFGGFVATVTQAVAAVVNEPPSDASRTLVTSLTIIIAWWLWYSGWRPGSK